MKKIIKVIRLRIYCDKGDLNEHAKNNEIKNILRRSNAIKNKDK